MRKLTCYLKKDTMSLHPDANEQMFCTGSWDESIKLWSYTDDSTSEEVRIFVSNGLQLSMLDCV